MFNFNCKKITFLEKRGENVFSNNFNIENKLVNLNYLQKKKHKLISVEFSEVVITKKKINNITVISIGGLFSNIINSVSHSILKKSINNAINTYLIKRSELFSRNWCGNEEYMFDFFLPKSNLIIHYIDIFEEFLIDIVTDKVIKEHNIIIITTHDINKFKLPKKIE